MLLNVGGPMSDKAVYLLLLILCYCGYGCGGKICSSITLTMASLGKLQSYEDCTAVDGSVVVTMIELTDALRFPRLREVSGFVVLYRVQNLTSLAGVFPELTVIRGLSTHENYALILFDLPDLKDMALPALRRIDRGGIRVESAPKLCYYDLVDWAAILSPQFRHERKFDNVPDSSLCSNVCPGRLVWVPDRSKHIYKPICQSPDRCWNRDKCQSLCHPACGESGCRADPEAGGASAADCCDSACYGGCFGPTDRDCAACRGFHLNDRCVDSCPSGYVSYQNWLCIKERECLSRSAMTHQSRSYGSSNGGQMKLHNGACVPSCPLGYATSSNLTCVKCADERNCARHCDAQLVHSIEDLEGVKGCTSVEQLIISLSDNIPNLEQKLTESFRDLTVIDNFLMVTNSRDLTSLSFLSNLRIIRGNLLADNQLALKVEHTDFLQTLWNTTTNGRRVSVLKGKVKFYMNRRLCFYRILEFVNATLNVTEKVNAEEDLLPRTNGDLAHCAKHKFDILVGLVTPTGVVLHWPVSEVNDKRNLVGYSIYYRQVGPNETVHYADPSTCEIRKWQTAFSECENLYASDMPGGYGYDSVESGADGPASCHLSNCSQCIGDCQEKLKSPQCQRLVENLKPATRYAMFVMPLLVQDIQPEMGSKSRIIYVETMPTQPSPPHALAARATSQSEIQLEWKPPLKPNGRVTHYLLWVKELPSQRDSYSYKDFCETKSNNRPASHRRQLPNVAPQTPTVPAPPLQQRHQQQQNPLVGGGGPSLLNASAAACRKHCHCEAKPNLRERDAVIYFEDTLFTLLFKRRPATPRRRTMQPRPGAGGRDRSMPRKPPRWRSPSRANSSSAAAGGGNSNDEDDVELPAPTPAFSVSPPPPPPDQRSDGSSGNPSTTSQAPTRAPSCWNQACPDAITRLLKQPTDTRQLADGFVTVRGTKYIVSNLKHFTHYELTLVACLEEFIHPQYRTVLHLCSHPTRTMRRTDGDGRADIIPADSLRTEQPAGDEHLGELSILWREPEQPNGAVKHYEVMYKSSPHRRWQTYCVSYQEWLHRGQQAPQLLSRARRSDSSASSDAVASSGNATASANSSSSVSAAAATVGSSSSTTSGSTSGSSSNDNNAVAAGDVAGSPGTVLGGIVLKDLAGGTYRVKVRANTLFGYGTWSPEVECSVAGRNSPAASTEAATGLGLAGAVAVALACALLGWLVCRRRSTGKTIVTANPDYWSYTYAPDEWEVPRDQVTFSENDVLGTGSFGRVYRGVVRSLSTPAAPYLSTREDVPVAVKNVNEKATMRERHEFLQEATHMKKFRQCAHVVRLIGVVSENVPILVLMELMDNGDLKTCLRQMRPDSDDPVRHPMYDRARLVLWCAQIADGMYYLETKKYIHRDLAARNCMVTAEYCVKIGDFGMTRDVHYSDYYKKEGQAPLPVRWMAPESLRDGVFTTATDVWSYGVVLWEIASLAQQPFSSRSNEEVLNMVKSGKTLIPPDDCPDCLADLMNRCWAQKPRSRSSFRDLLAYLDGMAELAPSFRRVSWYHNGCNSQGDSAVSVLLPDRRQPPQPAPQEPDARKQEEIPMLGQQSIPNPYVPLRA